MIKILLVDDEPYILKGLEKSILSLDFPVTILGKTSNGEAALQLIASNTPPDVLITDVKMPVMDGLTLIEKVNTLYPEILTVILSGYRDFEYARKSLRLNVYDYLLKPFMPEDIKKLLVKASEKKKSNILKQEINLLSYLAFGSGTIPENSLTLDYMEYLLCYICIGPVSNSGDYNTILENNLLPIVPLFEKLTGILRKGEKVWLLNGRYCNEKLTIIGSIQSLKDRLNILAQDLVQLLKLNSIPVTMAFSPIIKDPLQIGSNTQTLRRKICSRIIIGKSRIIYPGEQIDSSCESFLFPSHLKNKFNVIIHQKNWNIFKKELKKLVYRIEKEQCPQLYVERIAMQLLHLCQQYSGSKIPGILELEISLKESILSALNYEILLEKLYEFFTIFFDFDKTNANSKDELSDVIYRIEEYIVNNLSQQITLQILSDRFGYSPSYICNVFKIAKGAPPIEYLNTVRINKARELIEQQPDFLIKDIAKVVGFEDPLYFSRIFKKETGLSPSEYRDQLK